MNKQIRIMMVKNGVQENHSLWNEILLIDLSKTLQSIQVPYMILQGDTDIVESTKIVQELIEGSDNPNLKYEVVKDSGHIPGSEGMERVNALLKEISKN